MNYGCQIESIGVKLPEQRLSTADIEKQLKTAKSIKLELLTGISNRRVCNQKEDTLTLAVDAAEDCLKYSEFEAEEIEMIISCSISKYVNGLNHYYEPALSLLIKEKIGNTKALNFDVSNACAGMVTGVHIANNFIKQGKVKNCLVVSGEYITSLGKNALKNVDSIHHMEMASLTVGDAGSAVILSRTDRIEKSIYVSEMKTLGQYSDLCAGYQNTSYPGGTMETNMISMHKVSIENAPYEVDVALKKAGLKLHDIDFLIPHQTARISILAGTKRFSKYFKEKPGEVIINLSETGNTASTSHFTTLYKYLQEKRFKEGDKIMLVSFASGLVIGTVIFPINGIISRYGNNN